MDGKLLHLRLPRYRSRRRHVRQNNTLIVRCLLLLWLLALRILHIHLRVSLIQLFNGRAVSKLETRRKNLLQHLILLILINNRTRHEPHGHQLCRRRKRHGRRSRRRRCRNRSGIERMPRRCRRRRRSGIRIRSRRERIRRGGRRHGRRRGSGHGYRRRWTVHARLSHHLPNAVLNVLFRHVLAVLTVGSVADRCHLGHGHARSPLAQFVDFGEFGEGSAVDVELVLSKARSFSEGGTGVGDDFDNVIAVHAPRVLQDSGSVGELGDFLPVGGDETFAGCDGPEHGHVVFLPATGGALSPLLQRLRIGETEAPTEATLARHDPQATI
mmetsp:Transcript_5108/g.6406  ORF Transcript_5108/g.6406 Transcript_5108/m.6406 type:complete len:327 (-) Transcript_5108:540-1520(-)